MPPAGRPAGRPGLRPWALVAALALVVAVAPVAYAADELTRLAEAVNAYRAQNGVPPLTLQSQLGQAAQRHADYMAQTGTFNHFGASGSSHLDRIRASGYPMCGGTENIAAGAFGPDVIVRMWASSSGHRSNMLSTQYTDMGVGRSQAPSGEVYWVLVEGRPCGPGTTPPGSLASLPSTGTGLTLPTQPFGLAGTSGMPNPLTGFPLNQGGLGSLLSSGGLCAGNPAGCWPFSALFSPGLNGAALGSTGGMPYGLGGFPGFPSGLGSYGMMGYGGPLSGLGGLGMGGFGPGGYAPWGSSPFGTAGLGGSWAPSFGGYGAPAGYPPTGGYPPASSPSPLPGAGISPSGNCPLTGLC